MQHHNRRPREMVEAVRRRWRGIPERSISPPAARFTRRRCRARPPASGHAAATVAIAPPAPSPAVPRRHQPRPAGEPSATPVAAVRLAAAGLLISSAARSPARGSGLARAPAASWPSPVRDNLAGSVSDAYFTGQAWRARGLRRAGVHAPGDRRRQLDGVRTCSPPRPDGARPTEIAASGHDSLLTGALRGRSGKEAAQSARSGSSPELVNLAAGSAAAGAPRHTVGRARASMRRDLPVRRRGQRKLTDAPGRGRRRDSTSTSSQRAAHRKPGRLNELLEGRGGVPGDRERDKMPTSSEQWGRPTAPRGARSATRRRRPASAPAFPACTRLSGTSRSRPGAEGEAARVRRRARPPAAAARWRPKGAPLVSGP